MENWTTIERPGYYGARRDAKLAEYDARWGKGNWRLAWKVGDLYVDRLAACALYEDAYFVFMVSHPDVVQTLIKEARDVYDDSLSNVRSHFDYACQETGRTHIQDIAIRRVLLRMGLWFKGQELIQIRHYEGTHALSVTLSPGIMPFHRTDLLEPPLDSTAGKRWYDVDSVEDFYQRNKYLQAKT